MVSRRRFKGWLPTLALYGFLVMIVFTVAVVTGFDSALPGSPVPDQRYETIQLARDIGHTCSTGESVEGELSLNEGYKMLIEEEAAKLKQTRDSGEGKIVFEKEINCAVERTVLGGKARYRVSRDSSGSVRVEEL